MPLIRWLLSGRHCLPRREERHGLPVHVQGPEWETSVSCLHAQFWVVPANPVGSSTSRPSLDSAWRETNPSRLGLQAISLVGSRSDWNSRKPSIRLFITCSADQETLLFTFLWVFSQLSLLFQACVTYPSLDFAYDFPFFDSHLIFS